MHSKPFSARRAFQNDFAMTSGILIPVLMWVIFVMTMFFLPGGSCLVLYLAAAVTVLSPLLFWYRLRSLRGIFARGRLVEGTIRKLLFDGDRGRIHYSYEIDSTPYSASLALYRTKETLAYKEGQTVALVVDPNDPNRAYLRDLYT